MNKYGQLLRDPRWQQKRLHIMERDRFTCQRCGANRVTLNVHHLWYGPTPWDTMDSLLITLCEPCHKIEESVDSMKAYEIMRAVSGAGVLKCDAVELIATALDVVSKSKNPRTRFLEIITQLKNGQG